VEHHGENPPNNVIAIIPARYASTRLPGKMLLPIAGKPLIVHTVERAKAAASINRVIVATDDERIVNAVSEFGNEAVLTSPSHKSGSDRIAEVARDLPDGSIIVNVQGDEPLIASDTIEAVVGTFLNGNGEHMATACGPLNGLSELLNFNIVKVALGEHGNALYFSRSPMPFPREAAQRYDGDPNAAIQNEPDLCSIFRRHIGIYAYRREYLLEFANMHQTRLEKIELLEQLRALENGAKIAVAETNEVSRGVDTREDYERVRDLIEAGIDIRQVTREDLERVAAVHVESWQRSFAGIAPDDFLNSMSVEKRLSVYSERRGEENYAMLVVEHPKVGIVGFADFGTPKLPGNFDAQIFSFYFLPEFQRKGFGERLFRRCVSRLTRDGVRSLCLDSLEISPYRSFYDNMGGRVVGRDIHKFGNEDFETVIYGWDDISKL
jgi:3-deoxy-manno-octulosonate cytidylyltransferase (CMP-KDO synthetase)